MIDWAFQASEDAPDYIKAAYAAFHKIGTFVNFLGPHPTEWDLDQILQSGRLVRDVRLREIPILPGAVATFIQLASTREWAMAGKPRAAARAVEALNNAETYDSTTGQVFYGLEQYTRRRAMDYVTIGRTAFAYVEGPSAKARSLEYIDPTLLSFQPKQSRKPGERIADTAPVWAYIDLPKYRYREIALHHPLPVGTNRFIPPIYYLMPSATLMWLLQEHYIASLDGRKIRDILLVGNASIKDSIASAVAQTAALWAGEDVTKIGIPVAHLNVTGNQKIADLFHRIGLSEIPEKFDSAEFIDFYVNQISAALGLSLRHFWNTRGATTNRSVEEVAERRQENKGPADFVRAEERLINQSKFLDQFGRGSSRPRFGYVEEVDVSTRITEAQYLKDVTSAMNIIMKSFGASINLESYLAWMQSVGVLPTDMTLMDITPNQTIEQSGNNLDIAPGEQIAQGDQNTNAFEPNPTSTSATKAALIPDYEEILLNGNGELLDRRRKTFSVFSTFHSEEIPIPKNVDIDLWDRALHQSNLKNQETLRQALDTDSGFEFFTRWSESQKLFDPDLVEDAVGACTEYEDLSESEQNVVDVLVGFLEEQGVHA